MDLCQPSNSWLGSNGVSPPPAERFCQYPASWYLFGPSDDVRGQPVSRDMLGGRLVAYRTPAEQLVVLDARCAHLGADLGNGRVIGDAVQCPFHEWEYGPDGRCRRIPAQTHIPQFARQKCYPVAERHGFIFVFNGREALFPLPFFDGCLPAEFAAGRLLRFSADCTWYMLAANNYDFQHWQTMHGRQLIGMPQVDCPAPHARRVRFSAHVTGSSIFDRLLRRFVGETVEISLTNWGGVFFSVTGFFRRAHSYLQVAVQPLRASSRVQIDVLVYVKRRRNPLWRGPVQALSLWLRRLFTWGFMCGELEGLGGIRYSPHTLLECDREMVEFFRWAAALPLGQRSEGRNQRSEVRSQSLEVSTSDF